MAILRNFKSFNILTPSFPWRFILVLSSPVILYFFLRFLTFTECLAYLIPLNFLFLTGQTFRLVKPVGRSISFLGRFPKVVCHQTSLAILADFRVLNTLMTFDESYKLWSSSQCVFPHSPVTSSKILFSKPLSGIVYFLNARVSKRIILNHAKFYINFNVLIPNLEAKPLQSPQFSDTCFQFWKQSAFALLDFLSAITLEYEF